MPESLVQGVKMEVSLGSIAFPTVELPIDSYVYQFLNKENKELVEEYELEPFVMTLQSLERTFADKVFALCDYYLTGKIKRNSRHIYDIYMLFPKIKIDDELTALIHKVRAHRSEINICPSAKKGVVVGDLLRQIIEKNIYFHDYQNVTMHFQKNPISYETVVKVLNDIIDAGIFNDNEFEK